MSKCKYSTRPRRGRPSRSSAPVKVQNINRRIQDGDKIIAKIARSLLPGLEGILTKSEINAIDGPLRRGTISVMQCDVISKKLDDMRTGKLDCSHEPFSRLYQFYSLLKKYPTSGNDTECKVKALEKFKLGELQCKGTNERLRQTKSHLKSVVSVTQQLIRDILGSPGSRYHYAKVAFGPGSTVNPQGRSYSETSKFFKFTDKLYVPRRQKMLLAAHLSAQPMWMDALRIHYHIDDVGYDRLSVERQIFDQHFVVVPDDFGNKITFVPKNADEHRTIGVELNGSILLQKIFGDLIRDRLQRFGLDLNTQSRNVHFAKLAKTFGFATIDVANASNTLSYEVVKLLLPNEWFELLDCTRSHYGNNEEFSYHPRYEMFSSMGNGFTFELESLIFYTTALATIMVENGFDLNLAKRQVAVYGDDIIVPQEHAASLIENLQYIGFKTNIEKSFVDGKFFESCGSDYFDGIDVRPFFIKRQLKTVRDAYFLCNAILFKCIKSKSGFLFPAYLIILKSLRQSGTVEYGPLHFYEAARTHDFRESHDDLEAVLRVPLEYAQANGGVKFDSTLFAWTYKKWIRISVEVPLSLNRQYTVQSARYLTFLDGTLGGKAVYSGINRFRLVKRVTSSWDGSLTREQLTHIREIFFP